MDFITVNGVRIGYERAGVGQPLLLIGGTGMTAQLWTACGMRDLLVDAGFDAITYAARGVVPSDAPAAPYHVADLAADAAGLLDALGLSGVHVVGYSLGSFTAEVLTRKRPELVASLALIAGAGPTSSVQRLAQTMEQELIRETGHLLDAASTLQVVLTGLPPAMLRDDDTVNRVAGMVGATPWTSVAGQSGQSTASDDWLADEERMASLADIEVPALVVCFEHDLAFPARHGRVSADLLPRGSFVEVPEAAHLGPITHAEPTARAVIDHLLTI